jgi:hypothetical protein
MLHKQFSYLAGTGRTATHWIERLIQAACDKSKVATFHDNFPKRTKTAGRRNPAQFFTNYMLNLMVGAQGAQTYVECNPALLEHVALTYGVQDALGVIPGGLLSLPARGVLIVRSPYAYVASLKARGWGWSWWNYPRVRAVYDIGDGYAKRPMVEQAAVAWRLKNEFYHSLTRLGVPMIRFELLFDRRVTRERFAERIEELFDALGVTPIQGESFWWKLRSQRIAEKAKGAKLSSSEKETVKAICGPVMELFNYV